MDTTDPLHPQPMSIPAEGMSFHEGEFSSEHLADAILAIGKFFHDLAPARSELGNLTLRQLEVLDTLSSTPQITLRALADKHGLARSTTSVLVDRMVREGYLTRIENPKNRREVLLDFGTRGRSYQTQRREIVRETMQGLLRNLSQKQRDLLLRALFMMGQLIQDLGQGEAS
ncbi:MAG: MarR family transcriptional regulator [bacterium]